MSNVSVGDRLDPAIGSMTDPQSGQKPSRLPWVCLEERIFCISLL